MKKSIYIFSNGELKRKQDTLCFEISTGGKKYIPIENTEEIHIFGEVAINKKLLDFVSQKGILLHFYNYYGFYEGSFYPREHYNSGILILTQADYYNNFEKRIYFAKKFVEGAFLNMLKVLEYYNLRGENLEEEISKIKNLLESLEKFSTVEEIMAIEGNAKDIYYRSFNKIIKNENFYFEKREKRPPRNRINALISYGNSLLYTYVLSEIYKTHLDPRIGFLHTTNFRRFSLNLDIAEIFKPIIVDRAIFTVINKGMIKKKHFEEELGGIYLNEVGKKIFVEEMDKRMKTTIKHKKLGKNVSYRSLIRMELYKIEKHLLNDEKYEPFVIWW
ncbi:MAG TPA: type I-B CRISPR-associated endonuclease Cas1b [bacterium]|mgnify:CR=1 FL=1|nr:type I-B CRISPR-associated endonuclease Cas1b [bacterium]HPP29781.1 type I-B CRISPR-associated endonuclease Cas1b [bacterium]